MRGFPMNLSPVGMDEPGFPYFTSDKFDFSYGAPPFHPHDSPFFPGHPGMPFNTPGKYHDSHDDHDGHVNDGSR